MDISLGPWVFYNHFDSGVEPLGDPTCSGQADRIHASHMQA